MDQAEKELFMFDGFCIKCKNYKSCAAPCRPVEQAMRAAEKSSVMEKVVNENEIIMYPQWKQRRFSEIAAHVVESFVDPDALADQGVIENAALVELPMDMKKIRAAVFYKRFFQQKEYQTIADELHMSVENARTHYSDGKRWITKILVHLDTQRYAAKVSNNLENQLEPAQVWFLMSRLLGLSIPDIQKLTPRKYGAKYIQKRIAQVQSGEYVAKVQRQEMALEALGEHKNRMPKERIWFMMVRVWGLSVKEVQRLWPRKYSAHYIERKYQEVARAA
jgi:hypothetical protein